MAKLQVRYNPGHKQCLYTIIFNPSDYGIEESSTFRDSFEGCLGFVLEQFKERTRLDVSMKPFAFEVTGELPKRQREILEGIVSLYNRAPELYNVFANPESFRRLAEYFGHAQPKDVLVPLKRSRKARGGMRMVNQKK